MREKFATVDDYIKSFPDDVQTILQKIRRTIQKAAPKAEEIISYGMPAYKLKKERIAYFAAFKKHIGFFPPAPKIFKKEVSVIAGPRGNLQFPLDKPMPFDLIKRIVAYKVKKILEN